MAELRADAVGDEAPELDGRRVRGQLRRRQILAAATRLLRERDYQSVTMEDIGEAAGVTGPAVYRHFRSKDDVLIAVLAPGAELLWGPLVVDDGAKPFEVLEAYVSRLARGAVDNPDSIVLWYQQWRNLPEAERRSARLRMGRSVEEMARLLREARPELSAPESRVTIEAALVVAAYVGHPGAHPRLPKARLHAHLVRLATATLRA
jgi:AcrR family transcriptional regulator